MVHAGGVCMSRVRDAVRTRMRPGQSSASLGARRLALLRLAAPAASKQWSVDMRDVRDGAVYSEYRAPWYRESVAGDFVVCATKLQAPNQKPTRPHRPYNLEKRYRTHYMWT